MNVIGIQKTQCHLRQLLVQSKFVARLKSLDCDGNHIQMVKSGTSYLKNAQLTDCDCLTNVYNFFVSKFTFEIRSNVLMCLCSIMRAASRSVVTVNLIVGLIVR